MNYIQTAFPSITSSFMATGKYMDRTSYTIINNKLVEVEVEASRNLKTSDFFP